MSSTSEITVEINAPRFDVLRSTMAPLPIENVDTDQIIPAEYLKTTSREGLARGLFAGWRGDGRDFVLDDARYQGAQILVAGENFGCGSSREHAPWALLDHGIRAVISTRFADIFRSNSLKNGLLPIVVRPKVLERLLDTATSEPSSETTINLEAQTLTTPWGDEIDFEVDSFARRCLLGGVDALGFILSHQDAIDTFEKNRRITFDTRKITAAVA